MDTAGKPRVAMIGLGYIGLPTAAVIAASGCRVVGVDISREVVETLNRGQVHIEEADLDELVARVVAEGSLTASLTVPEADVFVIAVPTPTRGAEHAPDVSLVMNAAESIAPALRPGNVVILESTSPVGTTEAMRDRLGALRPDLRMPAAGSGEADISVAYCPERVLPGQIIRELVCNDRVIGGITPECSERAREFYRCFVDGECLIADARVAEMTKLVENSFRDVNIAFANELSIIADQMEIDVWQVIRLANRHPRVNILQPGPGVGGHCIAIDPWFIVHSAKEHARLIRTAREVNLAKTAHVIDRARRLVEQCDGTVACLGLAFKPDIDDFRESPALDVVRALAGEFGDRLMVCEPHMERLPEDLAASGLRLVDFDTALDNCETVILLVDHTQFREVYRPRLAGKILYDTRGAWGDNDG